MAKRIWVRNTLTGNVGYYVREWEGGELIEVRVPTENYYDSVRYWRNYEFVDRQRAPRSDRGKKRPRKTAAPHLRLVSAA